MGDSSDSRSLEGSYPGTARSMGRREGLIKVRMVTQQA